MKVPPYGKPLKALLQSGQLPDNSVYLYIGNQAWDKGKLSSYSRPTRTLILPPKYHPLLYDWPVSGCDILIIETSPLTETFIQELVSILFAFDADKAALISHDFHTAYYKKDF